MLKSLVVWRLAKFGKYLISLWITDQKNIDGDYVQVKEILDTWFKDVVI